MEQTERERDDWNREREGGMSATDREREEWNRQRERDWQRFIVMGAFCYHSVCSS